MLKTCNGRVLRSLVAFMEFICFASKLEKQASEHAKLQLYLVLEIDE